MAGCAIGRADLRDKHDDSRTGERSAILADIDPRFAFAHCCTIVRVCGRIAELEIGFRGRLIVCLGGMTGERDGRGQAARVALSPIGGYQSVVIDVIVHIHHISHRLFHCLFPLYSAFRPRSTTLAIFRAISLRRCNYSASATQQPCQRTARVNSPNKLSASHTARHHLAPPPTKSPSSNWPTRRKRRRRSTLPVGASLVLRALQ